jgi:predicted negative regulator of RcsB-dependent stress response
VDRITRSKLKTDRFAVEVEHSVEFVSEHKKQVIQYGAIALAVVLLGTGGWYYRNMKHDERQHELAQAMDVMQAPVTPVAVPGGGLYYPTEAAKQAAADKTFKGIIEKYPGSEEATVASSYLGAVSMDQNKIADAEKYFQSVADSSDKNYASMGKLSLAQVYLTANRPADAEKLLRSLYENPTTFVSKEQAAIALARALSGTKPAEARKLLDPLRTQRPAISQVAITLIAKLPPQ